VIGVFPGDGLEVVSFAQIRERTGRFEGTGDIADAVANGRLISRRARREQLTPLPSAIDTPDIEEVRR
jgi:hypothetical protein